MAFRQAFRFVVYSLAGLAMLLVIAVAGLAVRLSDGPISLDFLLPTIEAVLDRTVHSAAFHIDQAGASWRGWDDGLALSLGGVRINERSGSGAPPATLTLPHLDLKFAADALRQRIAVPAAVTITGASADLVRSAAGTLEPRREGDTAGGGDPLASLLAALRDPPDPARPLSYLDRLTVRDSRLNVADEASGRTWRVHLRDVALTRASAAIAVAADVAIDAGADEVPLRLAGDVRFPEDGIDARLAFSGLDGSLLGTAIPALTPLAALAFPLSGNLAVTAGNVSAIESISFELRGDAGELRISEAIARLTGEPKLEQTLAIESFAASGSLVPRERAVVLKMFDLRFAPGTEVYVPPVDHRFPLRSLVAAGQYREDRLVLDTIDLDLDGATIAAQVEGRNLTGAPAVETKILVGNLAMDAVRRYWPKTLAPGGLAWCAEHLSRGIVTMDIDLALADQGQGLDIARFSAVLTGEGARVDYLPDLPAVENARARGELDLKKLSLTILGGNAGGLVVRGGTVVLDKFEEAVGDLALDLDIAGPLGDAIAAISRQPLALTEGVGLDPRTVSGRMALRLQMGFPALKDLPLEDVRLLVTAEIEDAAIRPGLFGIPVENGDLTLRVDSEDLRLSGTAQLAGVPGRFAWEEDFGADAKTLSRIEFIARNAPIARIKDRVPGIDLGRLLRRGTVNGEVEFVRRATPPYQLAVKLDLTNAEAALPQLGWEKAKGVRTIAEATVNFDDRGLTAIPVLSAHGGGLVFYGAAGFGPSGALSEVTIERLIAGRTDITAALNRIGAGGWNVEVSGTSLDLAPARAAWERGEDLGFAAEPETAATGKGGEGPPPFLSLSADLATVWFGEDRSLHRVAATGVREAGAWTLMQLDAALPVGGEVMATLVAGAPADRRTLLVTAADTGATLRALGAYDEMQGGRLHISGEFDDSKAGSPLQGKVEVRDFTIVRAPLLARLLNVLALGGILDALRDSGISFQRLIVPFVWVDDVLHVKEARTFGISLGMTAAGTIDTAKDTIMLQGTLVPFYFLNAALGRIPVIGPLFTGDQKGGGLFAAAYTIEGPLADPSVNVNPLSTLMPGFLREVMLWLQELIFPSTAADR